MLIEYIVILFLIVLAVVTSIYTKKLTPLGGITGGALAILLYLGIGLVGIYMLGLFFLLGTVATSWKAKQKAKILTIKKESGQRTMGQVLANGGVAGFLGLLAIRFPDHMSLWLIMVAGSFSAALADTWSSELGSVYGKQFYNIMNLKKDQRGLDGVVSLEGLIIGIAGSMLIAAVYCLNEAWGIEFMIIVIAGTMGNLMDSLLGAAFERKGWIKNDGVNFLNTLTGAMVAGILLAGMY